jgi:hypothetical protein
MNIFVLDKDAGKAASFHNDRHVVKMILETAQLLCTAHHYLDGSQCAESRVGELVLRPTHTTHPCAKWVRESSENYEWAHRLGIALILEYERRYSKTHSYLPLMMRLAQKPLNLPVGPQSVWPQCMPARWHRSSAVDAYRLYYFNEKQHLAAWKYPATKPQWWLNMEKRNVA